MMNSLAQNITAVIVMTMLNFVAVAASANLHHCHLFNEYESTEQQTKHPGAKTCESCQDVLMFPSVSISTVLPESHLQHREFLLSHQSFHRLIFKPPEN